MKVVVFNSGRLGDVVFSSVLPRALSAKWPDSITWFVTSARGTGLLAENPLIQRIIDIDEAKGGLRKALAGFKPDIVIDLDNNFRSVMATLFLPAKIFRLPHRRLKSWLLSRWKINQLPNTHIVDQYLALVSELQLKTDGLKPDYFIPYKDDVPAEWLPENFQKNFVALCISASHNTRKLPLSRLVELCDKINKPIIVIGGSEDADTADALSSFFERHPSSAHLEEGLRELNKKTIVYNSCGKFNMHQQASIIRQSSYVFTYDNDFIAIGSAFGKEMFCIYGNTTLDFGRYPYQTRYTILENNRLGCRPCSSRGYGTCPLKHFRCMNDTVFDFYIK